MKHREAIVHLPDLGAGSLEPDMEAAVALHALHCATCADWLTARDLLAEVLAGRQPREDHHPDSALLALCVVRPEEVHEPDRNDLRIHLAHCSTCRRDLASVSESVKRARPDEVEHSDETVSELPKSRVNWSRALVARLAAILVGGGLFLGASLVHRLAPEIISGTEDRAASHYSTSVGAAQELSGRDLDGIQVIEGDSRLTVSQLTVRTGAHVTFRAGELVAFGDGFQVAAGGRMVAGSGSAGDQTDRGRKPSD